MSKELPTAVLAAWQEQLVQQHECLKTEVNTLRATEQATNMAGDNPGIEPKGDAVWSAGPARGLRVFLEARDESIHQVEVEARVRSPRRSMRTAEAPRANDHEPGLRGPLIWQPLGASDTPGIRRQAMHIPWELRYAQGTLHMTSSAIRELLKVTEQPEFISFAGGLLAPEVFPIAEVAAVTERLLRQQGV